MVQLRTIM